MSTEIAKKARHPWKAICNLLQEATASIFVLLAAIAIPLSRLDHEENWPSEEEIKQQNGDWKK